MAPQHQTPYQVTVKGIRIAPRKGAAMASVGNTLYLFSGIARNDEEADYLLDELLAFNFDPHSATLTLMPDFCIKGEVKPELRASAMFGPFKPNQLMLYGGVNETNKSRWVFELCVMIRWVKHGPRPTISILIGQSQAS
jgi:N-acetylneuraminic acid mutarotase